tara:strand:- start:1246 stop:2466 length:1221 start_codon:yes stop_codon:yes gene_type:complete
MRVALLTVGNEILSGDTINTNVAWIGQELVKIGFSIRTQITVKDTNSAITHALTVLLKDEPDLIIVTGGLGPTNDDVTRQTLFDFIGTDSEFDEKYWLSLSERYQSIGVKIPEINKSQAMIPKTGKVIPNPNGSARGFIFEKDGSKIIVLPGVPYEMKAMMLETVIPMYKTNNTKANTIINMRTTGIHESALSELIEPIISDGNDCNIGYYPSVLGVDIRISHKDEVQVKNLVKQLSAILKDSIYGTDKQCIEEVVVQLAQGKNKKIAISESCTGGLIGHRLTEVSGSSGVFLGGFIVYGDQSKKDLLHVDSQLLNDKGAVSLEVAKEMAQNTLELFDVDYGLSVTGIAGPKGGTIDKPVGLVYIGLADKNGIEVKKMNFNGDRERNKLKTSQVALNWLRLRLLYD